MSESMAATEHVLERIVMAKRLGGLHLAEAAGLLRALYEPTPGEIYASAEMQARYLVGFRDGRMILEVAR
jgi:hypothetical protein